MRYTLSPLVTTQAVGTKLILLDLNGNTYFSLNGTGKFIFERLIQGETPDAILDAICQTYRVDRLVANTDIYNLIQHLESRHLIEAKQS